MATTIFPNFDPIHNGKDGLTRTLYQDPPTLEFFNMDATITGKDGENYSIGGFIKAIYPVINTFVKNQSNSIKQITSIFTKEKTIVGAYMCILVPGGSIESTLDFPNMIVAIDNKDGADITQAQAEDIDTYTNNSWNFTTIWYMGSKYPLLR